MTENTNPGNFANRPTEEVKAIASMGGKASHGGDNSGGDSKSSSTGNDTSDVSYPYEDCPGRHSGFLLTCPQVSNEGRNPDGTFQKGSEAAKEAGEKGGHASGGGDGGSGSGAKDTSDVSGILVLRDGGDWTCDFGIRMRD